jgi:hypothetical protein
VKDDLLVSIKAFIISRNYNGYPTLVQGFLWAREIGCPINSIGASGNIDVPNTNFGVCRVKNVVLVTLASHPA